MPGRTPPTVPALARLDQTPFEIQITDLSHDGRGVARRPDPKVPGAGKAIFVAGALPGETVIAQQTARHRSFDEARTLEVLVASPDRVPARCPHFGTCGGCALQHLDEDKQIHAKQRVLLENLERIGHVTPESRAAAAGRRRLGLSPQGPLLGAPRREEGQDARRLPRTGSALRRRPARMPHRDPADRHEDRRAVRADRRHGRPPRHPAGRIHRGRRRPIALVFRHLQPLSDARPRRRSTPSRRRTTSRSSCSPAASTRCTPLWPHAPKLSFTLPAWDIELQFRPLDFIQVNAGLNQKMIASALALLDVQPGDRVLDLFCGLGNFTLPLARTAGAGGRRRRRCRPDPPRARERDAQRAGERRVPRRRPRAGPVRRTPGCAPASTGCCSTRRARAPTSCSKQLPLDGPQAHRLRELPPGLAGARRRASW